MRDADHGLNSERIDEQLNAHERNRNQQEEWILGYIQDPSR